MLLLIGIQVPLYNMRFVLTAQAWEVILRHGRPAAQTLGR